MYLKLMLLRWFVTNIGIVLVVGIAHVCARPHNGTQSRILTRSPKDFGKEQGIMFPDDDDEETPSFVSRIGGNPKCADGLPFCEEVEAYPYNHLKRVLKQNPMFQVFFGEDKVSYEVAHRIGNEDDEMFVCRSISKTIFPKIGKNRHNKWKFIINQGDEDGFIQGVQIEVCKNPEGECDIPGNLPAGYQTSCKQKYVYRRLLSLDDKGLPAPDNFKLPSACCCSYRQNVGFLSRFGRGQTPVR